jgi:hypothetical protein
VPKSCDCPRPRSCAQDPAVDGARTSADSVDPDAERPDLRTSAADRRAATNRADWRLGARSPQGFPVRPRPAPSADSPQVPPKQRAAGSNPARGAGREVFSLLGSPFLEPAGSQSSGGQPWRNGRVLGPTLMDTNRTESAVSARRSGRCHGDAIHLPHGFQVSQTTQIAGSERVIDVLARRLVAPGSPDCGYFDCAAAGLPGGRRARAAGQVCVASLPGGLRLRGCRPLPGCRAADEVAGGRGAGWGGRRGGGFDGQAGEGAVQPAG